MTVADDHIVHTLDPMMPVARFPLSFEGTSASNNRPHAPSVSNLPDFVASLDSLKHLLRLIDNEISPLQASGLTLHKLGDCLILDRHIVDETMGESGGAQDFDCEIGDPLLLLPSSLIDELSDNPPLLRGGEGLDIKNTFIHVADNDLDDSTLPRYHSAPPGGYIEPASLRVSPPKMVKDSMIKDLLRLPSSNPISEKSAQEMLPFITPDQLSPMSRVNRSVEWNVAGFTVLLGCEIVLMDTDTLLPNHLSAVRCLSDEDFWPNKSIAREAWLETSLLQVDKVAWLNRERRSVELVTSTSELSLEADVETMLERIQRALAFMHTECSRQGGTYCLVRGSDGCCLLYDVTELPKDCNVLKVSKDLAIPISKLAFSIASAKDKDVSADDRKGLFRKAWDLLVQSDKSSEEQELFALISLELASLESATWGRVKIVVEALSVCDNWSTESCQKLLVFTVSVLVIGDESDLSTLLICEALLKRIQDERREVECRNLCSRLNTLIGKALLQSYRDHSLIDESSLDRFRPLLNKVQLLNIPDSPVQRLSFAVSVLADSKTEWEAAALNELGSHLIQSQSSFVEGMTQLTDSLSMFINDLQVTNHQSLFAVLMNLAKGFKLSSLQTPRLDVNAVRDRFRGIAIVMAALKVGSKRMGISQSVIGMELVELGSALTDSEALGNTRVDRLSQLATRLSSILDLALERKLPRTTLYLGSLSIDSTAIMSIPTVVLARSCLDLSLVMLTEQDRSTVRPRVDYELARLIAYSNGDGKDALRHINKALTGDLDDDLKGKAICLKAAIEFKLEDVWGSISTLIAHLDASNHDAHSTLLNCLKDICIQARKSETLVAETRPILEAILRKRELSFIVDLWKQCKKPHS